jgi:6-phospho-3-hexuloisomerase
MNRLVKEPGWFFNKSNSRGPTKHKEHNMEIETFNTIIGEISGVLEQVKNEEMGKALACFDKKRRVFVDGEGRSGLMAKGFALRLMHLGYTVYAAGETIVPALREGDLFVAVSGSGSSANVVNDAAKAKKNRCTVLVVTSKPGSPLAAQGDLILRIPGTVRGDSGNDRGSVQLLSSLFDQSLHITLDALCLMISQRDNTSNENATSAHW